MNCQDYQTQIEESTCEQNLSDELAAHLQTCLACNQVKVQHSNLQQILQNLPAVKAPGDFNFRVKSRLERQKKSKMPASGAGWRHVTILSSIIFACALIIAALLIKDDFSTFPLTANQTVRLRPINTIEPQPEQSNAVSELPQQPAVAINQRESARQIIKDKNEKPELLARRKTPKIKKKLTKTEPALQETARLNQTNNSKISSLTAARELYVVPKVSNSFGSTDKSDVQELLKILGIEAKSETAGLRITSVRPNSEATKSGLKVNDLIQKINNEKSSSISERNLKEINSLTIFRSGQIKEVSVTAAAVVQP